MFKKGDIIQLKEDHEKWGVVTCWSNDGSTMYYRPRDCGFTVLAILPNQVEFSPENFPTLAYYILRS